MKDLEKARENLRGKISDKNEKLAVKNQQPAQSGVKPSQLKLGESVRIASCTATTSGEALLITFAIRWKSQTPSMPVAFLML